MLLQFQRRCLNACWQTIEVSLAAWTRLGITSGVALQARACFLSRRPELLAFVQESFVHVRASAMRPRALNQTTKDTFHSYLAREFRSCYRKQAARHRVSTKLPVHRSRLQKKKKKMKEWKRLILTATISRFYLLNFVDGRWKKLMRLIENLTTIRSLGTIQWIIPRVISILLRRSK